MKKILFLLLLVTAINFSVNAKLLQDKNVTFYLSPSGEYITEDGANFLIIPFDGKDSHQIYEFLMSNIISLYNDASFITNELEDKYIKIRAYSDDIIRDRALGLEVSSGGFYNIEIEIKDNRIKFHAPVVEEEMDNGGKYSAWIKGNYKHGALKEKNKKGLEIVQYKMNCIVNAILGANKKLEEDEW